MNGARTWSQQALDEEEELDSEELDGEEADQGEEDPAPWDEVDKLPPKNDWIPGRFRKLARQLAQQPDALAQTWTIHSETGSPSKCTFLAGQFDEERLEFWLTKYGARFGTPVVVRVRGRKKPNSPIEDLANGSVVWVPGVDDESTNKGVLDKLWDDMKADPQATIQRVKFLFGSVVQEIGPPLQNAMTLYTEASAVATAEHLHRLQTRSLT